MKSQLDHLDEIALQAAKGDVRRVGPPSSGERLYFRASHAMTAMSETARPHARAR